MAAGRQFDMPIRTFRGAVRAEGQNGFGSISRKHWTHSQERRGTGMKRVALGGGAFYTEMISWLTRHFLLPLSIW